MVHLLHGASAVQIQEDEVLFEEGAAADAMFFVLAGSIALRLGETELEAVTSGGIFGEMGMLENKPREARAVATETSVLLKVRQDTLQAADHEFRAIFFELVSRVLVRRLRSTSSPEGNNCNGWRSPPDDGAVWWGGPPSKRCCLRRPRLALNFGSRTFIRPSRASLRRLACAPQASASQGIPRRRPLDQTPFWCAHRAA